MLIELIFQLILRYNYTILILFEVYLVCQNDNMKREKGKTIYITLLIILFGLIFNSSCKKENHTTTVAKVPTTPYYQPALDNAEAEIFCTDIFEITKAALTDTTACKNTYCIKLLEKKDTASLKNDTNAHKIEINFGPTNTTCANQRSHRGKLIIIYSGHYHTLFTGDFYTEGYSVTIIPDSVEKFYIDNCLIRGRIIVKDTENLAKSARARTPQKSTKTINYSWEVNAQNFKITHTSGLFHYWNSARIYQYPNDTTAKITSVTTGTTGTDINGKAYTLSIDLALVKKTNCLYIDAGNIVFNVDGMLLFYINYGNGTCDNAAIVRCEVTANPNTYKTIDVTIP